jgi:hypothetical protein
MEFNSGFKGLSLERLKNTFEVVMWFQPSCAACIICNIFSYVGVLSYRKTRNLYFNVINDPKQTKGNTIWVFVMYYL